MSICNKEGANNKTQSIIRMQDLKSVILMKMKYYI